MTIRKKENESFGTCQADIRLELSDYAKSHGYEIHHFKNVACKCGGRLFDLYIDDDECVATRICTVCKNEHVMLDGEEYLEDTEFYQAVCTCGSQPFELTVGVKLYSHEHGLSDDVHWLFIGCRCPNCNLVGCYADWKNEFTGYEKLLSNA
ncbi:hypothetical protein [Aliikangiella coralliicola]|uniref:Uncharacterized protein n=1 Tax=Aliikangiella coralliicola TaxID=2592383 RepID=A0A545UHA9_9GAMM|nr:hypothetical protein [Aliikangiella coralliicola]TQV88848.1 hypothetical protein FLL46_04760 [Aliikangiella coralliicola]